MEHEILSGISVVLPVYNEQDCLDTVLPELVAACEMFANYEIIAVNDGSTDMSAAILANYARQNRNIRHLDMSANSGQSAALWAGFQTTRFPLTATIDADGQNDPRDIASCVRLMEREQADVCCGVRVDRHDKWSKRLGSRLANRVRRAILKDGVDDTGCPLKTYRTKFLKRLQYWNGMHRFLPALCQSMGAIIIQRPVTHRYRVAGTSKYTNFGRLKVTLRDLAGVAWLKARAKQFYYVEEEWHG